MPLLFIFDSEVCYVPYYLICFGICLFVVQLKCGYSVRKRGAINKEKDPFWFWFYMVIWSAPISAGGVYMLLSI